MDLTTNSANPAPAPAAPVRPEWLPEKFQSVEDMAKAYSELERRLGGGGGGEQITPPPAPSAPEQVDFSKYINEFSEKGTVSEESYQELERRGIARNVLDSVISSQKAAGDRLAQEAFATVGGQETYQKMLDWMTASEAVSQAELDAFNKAVYDPALSKLAIQGMFSRFQQATSTVSPRFTGNVGTGGGTAGYAHKGEMLADMKDPRYGKDHYFTKEVENKVRLSTF